MALTTYRIEDVVINGPQFTKELQTAFGGGGVTDRSKANIGLIAFDVTIDESVTLQQVETLVSSHNPNVLTEAQQAESSVSDLQAIRNKAEKVADDIKELALAIMLSDEAGDGLGARLTTIGTALQDSKPGFQSAFLAAFNAEYGIDVLQGNTVTLDVGIPALTTAQRRNLITFARNFLPMYIILLRL